MTIATATQVKQSFGRFHDKAQQEPVFIQKHGRNSVVLLSADLYAELIESRQALAVRDLDQATLDLIAETEMPADHDHLNALMDE
ncbi:type II toxin-antitoxin system prevent-host-death family antitoxin [Maricaulis sp.]|uniref:type II toxin-antitoxin system prevent-host-death family antitoxin n=1 Tax=Maricaulis sp. TaxID=1486257 RepID=UPI003A8D6845